MDNIRRCNVFISSPGNLSNEREIIENELKKMTHMGVEFNPIRWEKDLPTTSSHTPQELINTELLNKADILIGIFSTRFGSKTEHADSGTVEEIETFIAQNKPVILYFYSATVITTELTKDDMENLMKIQEFKKKYEKKNIYHIINNVDELKDAISRDIQYNLNNILSQPKEKNISQANKKTQSTKNNNKKRRTGTKAPTTPWYTDSIALRLNQYLKNKQIDFHYEGNITFHENLKFLTGTTSYTSSFEQKILEEARIEAFNSKYGHYNYAEDLRALFPNWGSQIFTKIINLKPTLFQTSNIVRILDIGGNDGSELYEIFDKTDNLKISVVDISNIAIDSGRTKYPQVEFIQSDMEAEYLNNVDLFDICLCLRSIQSRGVFSHDAIIQMCKHLKEDGIMLISIPNGYKHNEKIERGLYDHRSCLFLRTKPQELALKIERKLIDYGFCQTGIETIDTEIMVWGKRGTND